MKLRSSRYSLLILDEISGKSTTSAESNPSIKANSRKAKKAKKEVVLEALIWSFTLSNFLNKLMQKKRGASQLPYPVSEKPYLQLELDIPRVNSDNILKKEIRHV